MREWKIMFLFDFQLKLHIWRNSCSWVISQNTLVQSDLRIFLTVTSQERVEGLWRFFSCSWKLLWKLQIYYVVLVGCGQACLDMPEVCRQRTNNQCFCINLRDSVDFSDPVGQLWKFSHPFGENGCGQVCLGCLKLLRSSLWTTSQE